jgi:hypothetical protein
MRLFQYFSAGFLLFVSMKHRENEKDYYLYEEKKKSRARPKLVYILFKYFEISGNRAQQQGLMKPTKLYLLVL